MKYTDRRRLGRHTERGIVQKTKSGKVAWDMESRAVVLKAREGLRTDQSERLIIIEDLEGVVEDCFDDTDLPAGVGDVAS